VTPEARADLIERIRRSGWEARQLATRAASREAKRMRQLEADRRAADEARKHIAAGLPVPSLTATMQPFVGEEMWRDVVVHGSRNWGWKIAHPRTEPHGRQQRCEACGTTGHTKNAKRCPRRAA
jgi:hypothetical protein